MKRRDCSARVSRTNNPVAAIDREIESCFRNGCSSNFQQKIKKREDSFNTCCAATSNERTTEFRIIPEAAQNMVTSLAIEF